jgi:hypothetical protein
VHLALQLGAPASVECIRQNGPSAISFPTNGVVRVEFPARGSMPPVSVYYHESARLEDPKAFVVPGMENETILPPIENLTDKGRPMGRGVPGAPAALQSGSGKGVLAGNGSVLIGTKGVLATRERGEGVWLLPNARWREYRLPPQLLTRSPGHMLDWIRACKGGDPSCSDFSITGPFAEWLSLVCIAWRAPGKLEWDSKNLRFSNSVEANRYVKPVFRNGWELKL